MTQDDKPILTTMLYKHPGKHKIHGEMFDYIIVNDEDIDANLKKGWHKSTPDALNGKAKKNDGPSREEVKKKADELGIKYAKNIGTVKLQKMVEDKLEE